MNPADLFGINAPQVDWFFERVAGLPVSAWSQVAMETGGRPGAANAAGKAMDTVRARLNAAGRLEEVDQAGNAAFAAARLASALSISIWHGVAAVAPADQAEAVSAGVNAVTTSLEMAAIALVMRPYSTPNEFRAMWEPWESTIRLLAAEANTVPSEPRTTAHDRAQPVDIYDPASLRAWFDDPNSSALDERGMPTESVGSVEIWLPTAPAEEPDSEED